MNGAEIKEFRRRYNLTQEELAKIVESSLRAVQSWEQNNRNISKSALKLLELYSSEMLKSEQVKDEYSTDANENESTPKKETRPRIPLNAAAGSIGVAMAGITENDTEQLPLIQAFSNYNYTILVKGDSMLPEFHSGDEIACLILKGGTSFIQWGRYHVLDTAQGVVVKRIYDNGEYILCKSENSDLYPDFNVYKEEIYNIGLVIGLLRRY